jgi:ketosteroid isomerase-like protein
MTGTEEANLNTVRAYLAALEAGESGEALGHFFNADYRMTELPNRLNPNGRESGLANAIERSKQGKTVLRSQRYEIVSSLAQGNRVAFEVQWSGVLAIPLGTLTPASEMKAYFAMFLELRDGKISLQRNYDCFEPW